MNMFGNKLVTWTSCTTGYLTLGLKPANHGPSHPHGVPHLYTSRLLLRFPFSIVHSVVGLSHEAVISHHVR